MTPLERRYRRVLRLLPADYRAQWEEDMVDTFLLTRQAERPNEAEPADGRVADSEPAGDRLAKGCLAGGGLTEDRPAGGEGALADGEFAEDEQDDDFEAEFGRPSWGEVASVAALAARLRLGGVNAPPRSFARGEVVRRVALAGLLAHAVAAIVGVLSLLVTRSRFPEYRGSDLDSLWALAALIWVGAYVALLMDRRRPAAWLGGAALVPVLLDAATDLWIGGASVETSVYRLLVAAVPVLALAAFHREAPAVTPRPWLVALPVGVVVVMAVALLTQVPGVVILDWPGMLCSAAIIAGVAVLLTRDRGPWAGAVPVIAAVLLGDRLLTILDYTRFSAQNAETTLLITTGLVQAAALVLVAVPLALRRSST